MTTITLPLWIYLLAISGIGNVRYYGADGTGTNAYSVLPNELYLLESACEFGHLSQKCGGGGV